MMSVFANFHASITNLNDSTPYLQDYVYCCVDQVLDIVLTHNLTLASNNRKYAGTHDCT